MRIFSTSKETGIFIQQARQQRARIGFVPTMGALHEGHISLIDKAKTTNDVVVCSIFVNPTQFNDRNDLINYPHTPVNDHKLLLDAGCDAVFMPDVAEIYPPEWLFEMDFGDLERVMEGVYRPGHFKGVASVVARFFEIVRPDEAFFGEKDFQQLAVIKEMNRRLKTGIQITGCPTMREKDGLAMSSRNIHLSAEERIAAPVIYKSLLSAASLIRAGGIREAKNQLTAKIENFPFFKIQYLEFTDSITLQPIEAIDNNKKQRACIAVLTSKTRLIDNIEL